MPGPDSVTVHVEPLAEQGRDGRSARPRPRDRREGGRQRQAAHARRGVCAPFLADLDMVLVMSVEPGFSGQRYIEGSEARVARVADTGTRRRARAARAGGRRHWAGNRAARGCGGRRRAGVRQRRVRRRGPRARRGRDRPRCAADEARERALAEAGGQEGASAEARRRTGGRARTDGVFRRGLRVLGLGGHGAALRRGRARDGAFPGAGTRQRGSGSERELAALSRTRRVRRAGGRPVARSPATCMPPGRARSSSRRAPPRPTTRPCSAWLAPRVDARRQAERRRCAARA